MIYQIMIHLIHHGSYPDPNPSLVVHWTLDDNLRFTGSRYKAV